MTITVNLKGRLGNQLFQYATLRNLSIKKGYDFYIDTNLEWQGQSGLLKYFNIKDPSPIDEIKYNYSQPVNSNFYDDNINNISDNTILDGHFENVEYFDENSEIIKNELTVKDETINKYANDYMRSIINNDSKIVGIHFRRGDYIQQISDIDEFNKNIIKFVDESLDLIMKTETNITLLIFTGGIRKSGYDENWIKYTHDDDLLWVNNFARDRQSKYKIHISPGTNDNNELIDFVLLSKCDYLIIPFESTFSFMAYYVNTKIIKRFTQTNLYDSRC